MKKQTWQQWARACIRDPNSPSRIRQVHLSALTGQDTRAVTAVVDCWELYALSDEVGQRAALAAVVLLLPAMQEPARELARELIAFVLDWDDRERVWAKLATAREFLYQIGRMRDARAVLSGVLAGDDTGETLCPDEVTS